LASTETIKKCLKKISINFFDIYKNFTQEEKREILETWLIEFTEIDDNLLVLAVINAIKNNIYNITVGHIFKEINSLKQKNGKNLNEIWQEVLFYTKDYGTPFCTEICSKTDKIIKCLGGGFYLSNLDLENNYIIYNKFKDIYKKFENLEDGEIIKKIEIKKEKEKENKIKFEDGLQILKNSIKKELTKNV